MTGTKLTARAEIDTIRSELSALRADIEAIRQEGRRGDLASSLYLGTLLNRITAAEAARLARRGLESPTLEEAPAVCELVKELPDGRWDL